MRQSLLLNHLTHVIPSDSKSGALITSDLLLTPFGGIWTSLRFTKKSIVALLNYELVQDDLFIPDVSLLIDGQASIERSVPMLFSKISGSLPSESLCKGITLI